MYGRFKNTTFKENSQLDTFFRQVLIKMYISFKRAYFITLIYVYKKKIIVGIVEKTVSLLHLVERRPRVYYYLTYFKGRGRGMVRELGQ